MGLFKAKAKGLRTMRDAARECGLSLSKFWRLVRQDELLPKPVTGRFKCRHGWALQMPPLIDAVLYLMGLFLTSLLFGGLFAGAPLGWGGGGRMVFQPVAAAGNGDDLRMVQESVQDRRG